MNATAPSPFAMNLPEPVRMGRYLGPANVIRPISKIHWRVATIKNGVYILHKLTLLSSDQGVDVIQKLIKCYKESHSWHINWLITAVPFKVPVAYTATISPIPIKAISQTLPCVVDIEAMHRCHVITNALRKPECLPGTADLITSYNRFAAIDVAEGETCARDVLLVRLEFSRVVFLVFVISSIIFSVIIGVLAGIFQQSLNTGFGVFGAVAGVIGIIEGFLTWSLK